MDHKPKVMMKGTREGLILHLDDQCAFEDILAELRGRLSEPITTSKEPLIRVSIELGYRYITPEQEEFLKEIVREQQHLVVEEIDSKVMTKEAAKEWEKDRSVTAVSQTLRSGQVVDVKGDLLVIGDVNPGGTVRASGNVFVLGKLLGAAHAGAEGWTRAVIAASYLEPGQLRIADRISPAPDQPDVDGGYMECGYIDENEGTIRIERLQKIVKWRPELVSLERRMNHG